MSEPMQPPRAEPAGEGQEVVPEADATTLFFEAMTYAVGVDTVFGEPVTAGDRVIIPVAETSMGGGVGAVYFADGPQGVQRAVRIPERTTGGGGGASSRPVAVVVVGPSGVKVQPILDINRMALSGIASAAALWQGLMAFVKVLRKAR